MPTKTTSKIAKEQRQGPLTKLKALASGKAKPFLAVVIVLGVVGLGYYGYLRSNADTLSNSPPTVTCGVKLTNKECKQKQAASDAAFYDKLAKQCLNANRVASGNSCGSCMSGFSQDSAGACQASPRCTTEHRIQKTALECGSCLGGFTTVGDNCVNSVEVEAAKNLCAAAHTNYDTSTGGCTTCITGYLKSGSTCIVDTSRAGTALCDVAHMNYDATKKTCSTCKTGFVKSGASCVDPSVAPAALCAAAHTNYDKTTKTCTTCLADYVKSGAVCVPDPDKAAAALCNAAHMNYDATKKTCSTCLTGFIKSGANCVDPNKAPAALCAAAYHVYNTTTKTCGGCIEGYTLTAAVCKKSLTPAQKCALGLTDGTGCNMSIGETRLICYNMHRGYSESTKACSDSCLTAQWYFDNGVCNAVSTVASDKVKASCDKAFLRYDKASNRCLADCKATYVVRDSKCVEWTEAGMTKWRCGALGREWTPGEKATADTEATDGTCALTCLNQSTTQSVNTGNPDTSYCKTKKNVTGVDGVSLTITHDECLAQNRVWIGAIEACSARCKAGWFLNDGKCSEVKPATNTTTATSGTGACQSPLQADSVTVAHHPAATTAICPDDDPNTPPANTDDNTPVTHQTEVLMSHQTCALLGREWVPDAAIDGKKVRGGCSTQACRIENAEVRRHNGSAYCEGSVDRISLEACTAAHRTWLPEVEACAAIVGSKSTKAKVDAKQCDAPYTVYVHRIVAQGGDICVKPSAYQRVQTVAQNVGKPVAAVASLPAKALCKLQNNKAWIDGQCVKMRIGTELVDRTT